MNLENNSKNSISKELFLLYEKRKFIVIFLYDIIKQETLKNILWEEPNDLKESDPFSFEVSQFIMNEFSNENIEIILFVSENQDTWSEKEYNIKESELKQQINSFKSKHDKQTLLYLNISTHSMNDFISYYSNDLNEKIILLNQEFNKIIFKKDESLDEKTIEIILKKQDNNSNQYLLNFIKQFSNIN